jgi:hypothetical protein
VENSYKKSIFGNSNIELLQYISKGNPGALKVAFGLFAQDNGKESIKTFIRHGVYGEAFWRLYKEYCNESLSKLQECSIILDKNSSPSLSI